MRKIKRFYRRRGEFLGFWKNLVRRLSYLPYPVRRAWILMKCTRTRICSRFMAIVRMDRTFCLRVRLVEKYILGIKKDIFRNGESPLHLCKNAERLSLKEHAIRLCFKELPRGKPILHLTTKFSLFLFHETV